MLVFNGRYCGLSELFTGISKLEVFEADMGALNAELQKMSASYCIILKHVIQQFNPGGM